MNRLLVFLVVVWLVTTVSCGDIFLRGAINPGTQSASGVVSIVQFNATTGDGVSITIITLTGSSTASTFQFCVIKGCFFQSTSQSA
ncbi:MAG: hypothetical protein WA628_20625 [Terriglobales bacterium]